MAAFFAVQATRTFGASAGDVAALTAVLLASQTLSTLFWGAGADRIGLTPVLLASAVLCAPPRRRPPGAGPALVRAGLFLVGLSEGPGRDRRQDAPGPGGGAGARAVAERGAERGAASAHRAQQHRPGPLPRGPRCWAVLADVGGYRLTAAVALLASVAAVVAIALAAPAVRRGARRRRAGAISTVRSAA